MQEIELLPSTEQDNRYIHQQLRQYNRQFMRDFKDYSFHIKQDGQIVAGIVAASTKDTLEVECLVVEESCPGQGLGPLLLAAALAWLLAEQTLQAHTGQPGITALQTACRTLLPLAVLAGAAYNFCVYFAAEPGLIGQNPSLYQNVSRLIQFWL